MSLAIWPPAKGEDDDICFPRPFHPPTPVSQLSRKDLLTPTVPIDSSSHNVTSSSPDTERTRRGNPNVIRRPLNQFFIFRREYSHKHAKKGKRIRRRPGTIRTEKSLSKRAAEAWDQLSDEERHRYKELADIEKEEHARQYPNYRFQPVKKTRGAKESASLSMSVSDPRVSSMAGKPEVPASSSQNPPLSPTPPPPPALDMITVKACRRRSRSFPSLPLNSITFSTSEWSGQSSKPTMKRSRSVVGDRPLPLIMSNVSTDIEAPSFDLGARERSVFFYQYTQNEVSDAAAHYDPRSTFIFPGHYHLNTVNSPLAISPSSSLADWNGKPSNITPSCMPSPVEELERRELYPSLTEYNSSTPTSDPYLAEVMSNYTPDWSYTGPASEYSRKLWIQTSLGLESSGALVSPTTLYSSSSSSVRNPSLEHAQGVNPYAIESPEAAMYALNLEDYMHYPQ